MAANYGKARSLAEVTPTWFTEEMWKSSLLRYPEVRSLRFERGRAFPVHPSVSRLIVGRDISGITHVVGGVIRDEKAQIGIVQNSRNADQPCSASRHNGYILPAI